MDQDRFNTGADSWPPKYNAQVRRDFIFQDGYRQLNKLGGLLRNRIAISFVSELGIEEIGIDGGGVTKEFITSYVSLV